jgi:hypothetical protein
MYYTDSMYCTDCMFCTDCIYCTDCMYCTDSRYYTDSMYYTDCMYCTDSMYCTDNSVNAVAGNNNCLVLETLETHKYVPQAKFSDCNGNVCGKYCALDRSERYYFLTPRSRVLLEKLTGSQLVKKFPALYGTRRVITAFTRARYLSLS